MALGSKTVTICGNNYQIGALPVGEGLPAAFRYMRANGMILAAGLEVEALALPGQQAKAAIAGAGRATAMLAREMGDPEFMQHVFKPVLRQCLRNGIRVLPESGAIDTYYSGGDGLNELMAVWREAAEYNFGPFLRDFGDESSVIGALKQTAAPAQEPQSPTP